MFIQSFILQIIQTLLNSFFIILLLLLTFHLFCFYKVFFILQLYFYISPIGLLVPKLLVSYSCLYCLKDYFSFQPQCYSFTLFLMYLYKRKLTNFSYFLIFIFFQNPFFFHIIQLTYQNIIVQTIMYRSNQCLYQTNNLQNSAHYYSFVKKLSNQDYRQSLKSQNKQKHQEAVFTLDLNQTVPFNRSAIERKRIITSLNPLRNSDLMSIQSSSCKLPKNPINQHSVKQKNNIEEGQTKSMYYKSSQKEEKSGSVYQEIIKVLENENRNLKEHNRFLLVQYKKIQQQNILLKQRMDSFKAYQTDELKSQIQKLKQINQIYQKQIQELKYVLLQEIVSIHQKFNLVLSEQQSNQLLQELTESFKRSQIFTLNSSFFPNHQMKVESFKNVSEKDQDIQNIQNMLFGQLLQLDEDESDNKESQKTYEALNKENDSNSSNFGIESTESPPETTFSGQLKLSGKSTKAYDKEELKNNLDRIMQQRIEYGH